ncbi:MAG: hypothetical protein ACRCX4_03815 [Bacteroidales bacterium]
MKKFKVFSLMIVCFGLFSTLTLSAQQRNRENVDPKVRQENRMKRLTEELSLTPQQQDQITKMWNEDNAKRDEFKKLRESGKTEDLKKQMKELRESREAKMKQILSPEQYTKYLEVQNDQLKKQIQKDKHRKGKKSRGN